MDDEGQAGVTGEVAEPVTEPTPATTSIMDDAGNFNTGWRDTLDEDIRAEKCLDNVNNLKTMAKSYVHAQHMVGKDKVAIPNENSSEADWDNFYSMAGRPTTPADYNITKPEDMPDELFDSEYAGQAQELFHKIGLNKKQADALLAFHNGSTMNAMQLQQTDMANSMQSLEDGLHRDWGNAFEQRKHMGNLALEQGVGNDEGFKDRVVSKFGNDPDMIRLLSNLGSKFMEDQPVSQQMVPTTSDIQSQIDELTTSQIYIGGPGVDPAQHKTAVARVAKLYEKRNAGMGKT